MIPRLKAALGCRELAAACRVSGTGDVRNFERSFADRMGQKEAVAFPYGRTALMILLEAMGIRDREVICPAYTCVVVPHAVVKSGNRPVFVDSSEADFNMDLDLTAETISDRTAVIVATSIFGYPVDLDRLAGIKARHPNVSIIQDCCHSFACEWKGRPVHRFGDFAFFGLNISKLLTSIFGGMMTTDDEVLAARARELRDRRLHAAGLLKGFRRFLYLLAVYPAFWEPLYGVVNGLERCGMLASFTDYYDEAVIDMPADHLEQMTPMEARVGLVQLKKYDAIIAHRRRCAAEYGRRLKDRTDMRLPPLIDGATYSHYVPRVSSRDEVIERAARQGVQLGRLIDYSVPEMTAYRGARFTNRGVAERLKNETINLPVHGGIGQREQDRIIRVLSGVVSHG